MTHFVDIGSRRELFVDGYMIDNLHDAALKLHAPQRREVVFQIQGPIENACTGCFNFTVVDDGHHLYYRGFYPIGQHHGDRATSQTTHLALSADGTHFERPSLGLIKFSGSTDNNIVYQGLAGHNLCVFRDNNPQAPAEQRFKAVGGVGKDSLFGFYSADGKSWQRLQDEPLDVTGAFDSLNVPLWDPYAGCYRLFSRYFETRGEEKVRAVQSCTSEDFIHWSEPQPHRYAEGVPLEHFYTNATSPCPGAEHILVSFPKRFLPDRILDTEGMDYPGGGLSDAIFMSSRNGVDWDRTFLEAWVRPGLDQRNWTHRSCTPAPGILETGPEEWSMYLNENYGWDTNNLRRVTVRPHGFASLSVGGALEGGEVLTHPLRFEGAELRLNYATSAAGSIHVELQDESGVPLPGFAMEDAKPIFGDCLDGAVSWAAGFDLSTLRGRPVRIRMRLRDADVFALRFA